MMGKEGKEHIVWRSSGSVWRQVQQSAPLEVGDYVSHVALLDAKVVSHDAEGDTYTLEWLPKKSRHAATAKELAVRWFFYGFSEHERNPDAFRLVGAPRCYLYAPELTALDRLVLLKDALHFYVDMALDVNALVTFLSHKDLMFFGFNALAIFASALCAATDKEVWEMAQDHASFWQSVNRWKFLRSVAGFEYLDHLRDSLRRAYLTEELRRYKMVEAKYEGTVSMVVQVYSIVRLGAAFTPFQLVTMYASVLSSAKVLSETFFLESEYASRGLHTPSERRRFFNMYQPELELNLKFRTVDFVSQGFLFAIFATVFYPLGLCLWFLSFAVLFPVSYIITLVIFDQTGGKTVFVVAEEIRISMMTLCTYPIHFFSSMRPLLNPTDHENDLLFFDAYYLLRAVLVPVCVALVVYLRGDELWGLFLDPHTTIAVLLALLPLPLVAYFFLRLRPMVETLKDPIIDESICFPAGTPVLLANGQQRAIEDVRVGDTVATRDPANGKLVATPVEFLPHGPNKRIAPCCVLRIEGRQGELRLTPNHLLMLRTAPGAASPVAASKVAAGDVVFAADPAAGQTCPVRVTSVATGRICGCYSLHTGEGTFFAGGVWVSSYGRLPFGVEALDHRLPHLLASCGHACLSLLPGAAAGARGQILWQLASAPAWMLARLAKGRSL